MRRQTTGDADHDHVPEHGNKGAEVSHAAGEKPDRPDALAEFWREVEEHIRMPENVLLAVCKARGYLISKTWTQCSQCGKPFTPDRYLVGFGPHWQALCQECV